MIELTPLPHDRRNFVHKRLLGAAKSFVTSGFNPLAAVSGFVAPRAPRPQAVIRQRAEVFQASLLPVRRPPPRTQTARPSAISAAEKELGRTAKFGGSSAMTTTADECKFPRFKIGNQCIDPTAIPPGGDPLTERIVNGNGMTGMGEAVMGRYGAAVVPGSRMIDRAVCARGMQLGNDGMCYNKGQISNRQRMWPAGRKPLLTGGEMRAISVAATAGRRLERASKRLQKIGLMKKPPPRRKMITSGSTEHHHHT